jgi:hypothetical protein
MLGEESLLPIIVSGWQEFFPLLTVAFSASLFQFYDKNDFVLMHIVILISHVVAQNETDWKLRWHQFHRNTLPQAGPLLSGRDTDLLRKVGVGLGTFGKRQWWWGGWGQTWKSGDNDLASEVVVGSSPSVTVVSEFNKGHPGWCLTQSGQSHWRCQMGSTLIKWGLCNQIPRILHPWGKGSHRLHH